MARVPCPYMKPFLIGGILLLAFLGVADSWYLADSALKGSVPACDVTVLSGCEAVAQSPYSKLFGIPLGVYGTFFYTFAFSVGMLFLVSSDRRLYRVMYATGVIGFLLSICFMLIQALLIKSFCIYCIISAVLATGIFALSRSLFVHFAPPKSVVG